MHVHSTLAGSWPVLCARGCCVATTTFDPRFHRRYTQVLDLVDTEELRVMFRLLGQRPVGGHALLSYRFIRSLEKLRLDDDLINVRWACAAPLMRGCVAR